MIKYPTLPCLSLLQTFYTKKKKKKSLEFHFFKQLGKAIYLLQKKEGKI